MMKINGRFRNWSLLVVGLLVVFGLAACGGGGVAGGGIGGTGKSVGAISAFGSIFVNGVEFHTNSAVISIDDSAVAGTQGDLKLGMVVVVEGEFNDDGTSGNATTVSFNDVVEGPMLSGVNTTEKSFNVMGQVVFYTASTVFEESGGGLLAPTALTNGNVVEVSGLVDSAGQIKATRVERKAPTFISGTVLEVTGLVANLNTSTATFNIGQLAINYSAGATTFDNMVMSGLVDGLLVEVKGDDNPNDGLEADRIELKVEDFGNDGDLLQFEGVVTSIASSSGYDFEVNGLPVVTNIQTEWRGGYTQLSDVTLDDEIEVEGTLQDQGGTLVLVAREVELEIEDDVRFEGPVQSVDASANILSIINIGVAYSDTTSITEFEDKDGVKTAIDNLTTDDWVRIEGALDAGGNVFATRVEQDNGDTDLSRIILQGPAAGTPGPTPGDFTILGVTITRQTGVQYEIEDVPVSATVFFTNLTDGRFVKARGTFSGGILDAEELDLQN